MLTQMAGQLKCLHGYRDESLMVSAAMAIENLVAI
jgi:hypothetical protein